MGSTQRPRGIPVPGPFLSDSVPLSLASWLQWSEQLYYGLSAMMSCLTTGLKQRSQLTIDQNF